MADDNNPEVPEWTTEFTKICDGVAGAEGPVFTPKGAFYLVAPEKMKDGEYAGEILKVDNFTTGQKTVLCAPAVDGHGGVPAGCQIDKADNIWIADMRLGILRVTPSGQFKQVAKTDCSGETMQGCNDCIYDYDGNLWVTAPAGKIAPHPYERSSVKEPFGVLYCYTSHGETVRVDKGFAFCNGIAVQHNAQGKPTKLIVAETPVKKLWSYDIVGAGMIENKKLWGIIPGTHEGGPDGMDFDKDGNLIVANWGSSHLEVFGPSGGHPILRIKCPFACPSNLHFMPKSKEVYVTEHTNHALWKFTWRTDGMPQYCEQ